MKRIIAALFILTFIAACDKDESCPVPTYQIAGLWTGTYTVDQLPSQGNLYYSLIVKPDGTLLTESKGGDGKTYYASGTWTLNGAVFSYTIMAFHVDIQQGGTLTYSSEGKLSSGTWKNINNSPTQSGTFPTMNRVN